MKNKILLTLAILFGSVQLILAQDVMNEEAMGNDIADHLDLKLIASLFGEANDLEHFEHLINDPQKRVSNLDLNGDGKVDYLRTVEVGDEDTRLVVIQSVFGENKLQDIATIEVVRDGRRDIRVQVVGDVYLYGTNYIIEPDYELLPPIFDYLYRRNYEWYVSPSYWAHYPSWYKSWSTSTWTVYHDHSAASMHPGHTYKYVQDRHSTLAPRLHLEVRRNDYATKHPNKSFINRNNNVKNYRDLQTKSKNPEIKSDIKTKPNTEVKTQEKVEFNSDTNTPVETQQKASSTETDNASKTKSSCILSKLWRSKGKSKADSK